MTDQQTRQEIRLQQLAYMQQRGSQGAILNIVASLVVAAMLLDNIPLLQLVWWQAALLLSNALRLGISRLSGSIDQTRQVQRILLAHTVIGGLNGLAWGFGGILLPGEADIQTQTEMVLVLAAVLGVGSFNYAAFLPASIVFALGLFLPMATLLDIQWSGHRLEFPLLLTVYLLVILIYARRHNQQLLSAITLAKENDSLVDKLRGEIERRQHLEEASRQAEGQLRTLIDTAPDGIIVVNKSGAIQLANAEAHRLFGYENKSLLGESVDRLVPEAAAGLHAALRAGYNANPVRRPISSDMPLHGRRQDGTQFPVEIGLSSVVTPEGQLTYAAVRDLSMHHHLEQLEHEIQERRKAEDALQKLYREQTAIVNGTQDHIAHMDPDGNLTWWNHAVEKDLGLDAGQHGEVSVLGFIPPAEKPIARAAIDQALRTGSAKVEAHLMTVHGPRLYEFRGVALKDAEDKSVGIVTIGRNIEEKRENERLVAEAQQVAHLAHWRLDVASGDCVSSEEGYRIYGQPHATGLSRSAMLEATHPDDRKLVLMAMSKLQRPGDITSYDHRILWPDNSLHWLHTEARAVAGNDGQIHEIRGTVQEITERKLMEQSLRDSEQRLELAIAGSNDGIWDWSLKTNEVYFSPRWKAMLGYKDHELPNRFESWQNHLHPDDLSSVLQHVQNHVAGRGKRFEIEFRMRHKDGHYVHILSRGQVIKDGAGQPYRFTGTHVDISERKRAEALEKGHRHIYQLLASSGTLPEMLQALVDLIVSVDPDTHASILLLDEEGKHLHHGASHGLPDFYNQAIEGIAIGPEIGSCGSAAYTGQPVIAKDIHSHPNWQPYLELTDKAGLRSCWSQPIIDSSGKVIGTFANYHDHPRSPNTDELSLLDDAASLASIAIERHRMQTATLALQTQLQQAQKMEAIGHLAGGIAHDFNNILATIMGFTELSIRSVNNGHTSKLSNYLTQVDQAAVRARDLVKKLLTFSRIKKSNPAPAHLGHIVDEIGGMLSPLLPSSIELQLESADITTAADPVQIQQVLMNLAINARDAIGGQGILSIRLSEEDVSQCHCAACHAEVSGHYAVIRVQDTGPGIDHRILQRMFEPFASTKEIGKGSGMGLAITHGIIHEHDGHILVDSKPGHTEFKLLIPLVDTHEAPVTQNKDREISVSTQVSNKHHLMVVDDEAPLANMLSELLQSAGYQVSTFNNGNEALEHLHTSPDSFDLVITDQTMPGLSGSDMSKAMLALRPNLPIILCTGFSDQIDETGAKELGISAFLMKPVDNQILRERIHKLLTAAAAA